MFMKAFVELLMERIQDARPTECTILTYCQTHVFEIPKMHITTASPVRPTTIIERPDARATVVSDLKGYFRNHTPFQHFNNSDVLRFKVDEAIYKYTTNSKSDWFRLFVVIEQETPCKTRLAKGTCYIVDQEYVGGYKGKEAVIAHRVGDAPWPKLDEKDSRFVNFVLATVKIVQGETEVIREVIGTSCFFDDQCRAVDSTSMSLNANLSSSSPTTEAELADKFCELQKLAHALECKHCEAPKLIEGICDALRSEDIKDDHYHCVRYLLLYEATLAMLSGNEFQNFRKRHRAYRNSIAHPKPNMKIDTEQLRKLQSDVFSTIKKHFLDT